MIQTSVLTKKYGETPVVDGISLEIPKGKMTSIIGPNGAGKSTFLGMISRTLKASEGAVFIDDKGLSDWDTNALAKQMAIMKQSESLSVRITVEDFVSFGRYPYAKGRLTKIDYDKIHEAIAYMDLEAFRGRYIDELSGGQRQRAYIASILAQDTSYILLDEPLNNLDMKYASEMLKILRRLVDEKGKTIVIVIHDINFASCYSDHLILLKDGKLAVQGEVASVMTQSVLEAIYEMPFKVYEMDGKCLCSYY